MRKALLLPRKRLLRNDSVQVLVVVIMIHNDCKCLLLSFTTGHSFVAIQNYDRSQLRVVYIAPKYHLGRQTKSPHTRNCAKIPFPLRTPQKPPGGSISRFTVTFPSARDISFDLPSCSTRAWK